MATVYLHVGMPKTGTTFLQALLFKNNKAIRKKGLSMVSVGYNFPNISRFRNGHFIIKDSLDENGNIDENLCNEIYNTCLSNILKEAKKYETLIITDELIWIKSETYIERFKTDLDANGVDLKILVYLRRQDMFLESYWGQMVKIYTTETFREYASVEHQEYLHLDYKKHLEYYESIVGNENLIVRPYERNQFGGKNNNLLSDFLMSIGYDDIIDIDTDLRKKSAQTNPSISGVYLESKRVLNSVSTFRSKMNFFTNELWLMNEDEEDVKKKSNAFFFSFKERVNIVKKYEETNDYIAKKYLNQDKLFYDEIKNDDENYYEITSDDVGLVLGRLLSNEYKKRIKYEKQIENYKEKIRELKKENKKLQSTVNWMSVSFPKKVLRKIKNTFKK